MLQRIEKIKNVYMLGICGTAMASLAAMLKESGLSVSGSDENVYPPMSTFLEEHNIKIFEGYDPSHLEPRPDLIVIGNVISRGNSELEVILDNHFPYISLPKAIREFFLRDKRSIVVTGTHGKTTTASLIAWLLNFAEKEPGFLIGGIPNNFGQGYRIGKGKEFVIEGDEYDSAFFEKTAKFLHYRPDIGVINNIEFDHADIYNSLDEIETAFKRFVNLIPRNGLLVACTDYASVRKVIDQSFCPIQSFGLTDQEADWTARNIKFKRNLTEFTLIQNQIERGSVEIPMTGYHNVRNVLAAFAVLAFIGIDLNIIRKGLIEFTGVKRRLEYKGNVKGITIYDDFGHHPTAIRETLAAFQENNPGKRIWAIFEPRTATSRTTIFQEDFIDALALADSIVLAPVHRPDKAPGGQVLSCSVIANTLRTKGKKAFAALGYDEIVDYLIQNLQTNDLVITFSNGPFGGIHEKLLEKLNTADF